MKDAGSVGVPFRTNYSSVRGGGELPNNRWIDRAERLTGLPPYVSINQLCSKQTLHETKNILETADNTT